MTYFTPEHTRVAAILYWQYQRLDRDLTEGTRNRRLALDAINSIIVDMAVMYRDANTEFDFPRFLRESRNGITQPSKGGE